jgi:hypothetical protein
MIEIEGVTYYSKEEIKHAQLHHYISLSITDNSNNHSKKASLYFDSNMRIESIASSPKYNNGIVHLKGIFEISIKNIDSFDDEYLLLKFTKHSFLNEKRANKQEPIKINPCEIIFNYINFPEIYSTMLRNIEKTINFYTFLPRYYTKKDIKEILKLSRYTKSNPNTLLKEVDTFELKKEFIPEYKNWYENISSNPDFFKIKNFGSDKYITLELLKDYFKESILMQIINLVENRKIKPYLYINTNGTMFDFGLVDSSFYLEGFLTVKPLDSKQIEFQANQSCFIQNVLPSENSFNFSTNAFENLVRYIDIKNNLKIEKTFQDIKSSIIKNSILHTQDIIVYFSLKDLRQLCENFNFNFHEEEIFKKYQTRERSNKRKSKTSVIEKPIQTQNLVDFIVEFKINDKRKSDNRIIILSALQNYIKQYPLKTSLPEFDGFYNFIKVNAEEIDLIHEVESKKILRIEKDPINRNAFEKAFNRLIILYRNNFVH